MRSYHHLVFPILLLCIAESFVASFVVSYERTVARKWHHQRCKSTRLRHQGTVHSHESVATTIINSSINSKDQEEDQLMQMERNLRFASVGKLFTDDSDIGDTSKEEDLHLHVVDRLTDATVLIVGLGGVGSWAAEALGRSGVGHMILIDLDDICISNTNRQVHATSATVGSFKIEEMKRRLQAINPECQVTLIRDFVSPDNIETIFALLLPNVTVCLDAIDGAKGKSALIAACSRHRIPIVTCGGSAGRTDPTKFICEDLARVSGDPLLAQCRRNLRKFSGFHKGQTIGYTRKKPQKWRILAVVSTEPQKNIPESHDSSSLRRCDGALGTACFTTGTAGFVAAGKIVDMIANDKFVYPRQFRGNQIEPPR